MSSGKCRPSCLGLNVLMNLVQASMCYINERIIQLTWINVAVSDCMYGVLRGAVMDLEEVLCQLMSTETGILG